MSRRRRAAPVPDRIAELRSRLVSDGIAATLPPGRLEEDLEALQSHLVRPSAPSTVTRTTVRGTWWHTVEEVTVSSGPRPLFTLRPVRDAEGRVDDRSTVDYHLLVREATAPGSTRPPGRVTRAITSLHYRRLRRAGLLDTAE